MINPAVFLEETFSLCSQRSLGGFSLDVKESGGCGFLLGFAEISLISPRGRSGDKPIFSPDFIQGNQITPNSNNQWKGSDLESKWV